MTSLYKMPKKLAIKNGYIDIKNSSEIIDTIGKNYYPTHCFTGQRYEFIRKVNKRYLKSKK